MRAEVVEESRARTGNFTPTLADLRAISIDAGFEQNDPSNEIPAYRVLDREKIAVPAPVLEHREQYVVLLCDSTEMSRLLDGNCERLVPYDGAGRAQRHPSGPRAWPARRAAREFHWGSRLPRGRHPDASRALSDRTRRRRQEGRPTHPR